MSAADPEGPAGGLSEGEAVLERLAERAWRTTGGPDEREQVHEDRAVVLAAVRAVVWCQDEGDGE